jgi:hypothetical protein
VEGLTLPNDVDAVLDQIEAQQAFELEPNATSLTLLQKVYRNSTIPLVTRMRAAIAALPFESPKLAVVATLTAGDFADQLDRAVERSSRVMKTIDHQPTQPPPSTVAALPSEPTTSTGHKPSVPDRRYRRR